MPENYYKKGGESDPVLDAVGRVEDLVMLIIERVQILEANSEKTSQASQDLRNMIRSEVRLALSELVRGQIR